MADVVYVSNKAIINEGTASYVKVKDSDGTIEKRGDHRIFRWRQCGDHGGTFRGRDGSDRKSGDGRMKPSELLRLVWINITQNKFKTIMTSIGIIVGAATIVMVIAIGKGGQEDVADQFKT